MDLVGIISNHPKQNYTNLSLDGIPFHYLPVSRDNRSTQEAQIEQLLNVEKIELVVLARYMQILSDGLVTAAGRGINIHHSFSPAFKVRNLSSSIRTKGEVDRRHRSLHYE